MWKNRLWAISTLPVVDDSEPPELEDIVEIWPDWQANV